MSPDLRENRDAAAGGHVSGEVRKIEMDQLKSFLAAVGVVGVG